MTDLATKSSPSVRAAPIASESVEPALGSHIPALDGIRGLAILSVVIHHMTIIGNGPAAIDRFVYSVFHVGWIGVDLFFVLSGFLITGILYDAKGEDGYFRNFYARRTLRIFPLYYAVVFFSLVILPHIPNSKTARFARIEGSEIWYWTYLSNYSIAYVNEFRHGILDVSWSLAIEEQFYLVWPAVVLLLDRKTLMKVCGVLMIVALGTRLYLAQGNVFWIRCYVLTPCRMDALAAGAFVALAARGPRGARALIRPASILAPIAAIGIIAMKIIWPADCESMIWERYSYTISAVGFASFLLLAITRPANSPVSRVLGRGILATLGKYSYAMYLFHLPLRAFVRDIIYGPDGGRLGAFATFHGSQIPGQILYYAISLTITFIAAWLSWNLYEKHFLRLKRWFHSPKPRRIFEPATIIAPTIP